MPKNVETTIQTATVIEPSKTPLVKPEEVNSGQVAASEKALSGLAVSAGLTAIINRKAEEANNRLLHKAAINEAVTEYWQTVEAGKADAEAGKQAAVLIENATGKISHALAEAILAEALDRKAARAFMGQTFGFEVSDKSGKPTSKPLEPGNTISKRVSSVTIAAEYAMTGQLPDKGGDSLPLVGQDQIADLLSDYFDGNLSVRAASERIEQAIKDARISIPLEMNPEKLLSLVGKIQNASEAIAKNETLKEVYAALLQTVASIPFE